MKRILLALVLYLVLNLIQAQATLLSQESPLVFTHINVIDATGEPPKRDMTVVVAQGRTARIEASAGARIPTW